MSIQYCAGVPRIQRAVTTIIPQMQRTELKQGISIENHVQVGLAALLQDHPQAHAQGQSWIPPVG